MFCMHCSAEVLSSASIFCHICGRDLDFQVTLKDNDCGGSEPANDLITEMFHRGYPYNVIVGLLEKKGHKMHVRTLKRRLSDLGLKRKGNEVDEDLVESLIRREVEGAGRLAGYRNIWHALRLRYHAHVPRSLVSRLMKKIDPEGVEDRKARRLNTTKLCI